jgi:predicted SpoU family rRNA methylase
MSRINFTLMSKAFSVNAYSYRDKRHKTAEARAWEAQMLILLDEHSKALGEMADDWKKHGGCFRAHITVLFPPHIFYNRDGAISSKTFDLTNIEKPIIDLIFGQIMEINDKTLVQVISEKLPGPLYAIEVSLELDRNTDADSLISAAAGRQEDGP